MGTLLRKSPEGVAADRCCFDGNTDCGRAGERDGSGTPCRQPGPDRSIALRVARPPPPPVTGGRGVNPFVRLLKRLPEAQIRPYKGLSCKVVSIKELREQFARFPVQSVVPVAKLFCRNNLQPNSSKEGA